MDSDFAFVEKDMLTLWILLWLAAVGECVWFFMIRKRDASNANLYRTLDTVYAAKRADAQKLLDEAKKIHVSSQLSQEHKVCDQCHRIVVQHMTHDDGRTLCANCSIENARKETVNG
jgi:hypothetical protein